MASPQEGLGNALATGANMTSTSRITAAFMKALFSSDPVGDSKSWDWFLDGILRKIQPYPQGLAASDSITTVSDPAVWTTFQVNGFRNEIKTYYNQPEAAARLLRVLRRLSAKKVCNDALRDTAIEVSLMRLRFHPRSDIQDAAFSMLGKWIEQDSQSFRSRQAGWFEGHFGEQSSIVGLSRQHNLPSEGPFGNVSEAMSDARLQDCIERGGNRVDVDISWAGCPAAILDSLGATQTSDGTGKRTADAIRPTALQPSAAATNYDSEDIEELLAFTLGSVFTKAAAHFDSLCSQKLDTTVVDSGHAPSGLVRPRHTKTDFMCMLKSHLALSDHAMDTLEHEISKLYDILVLRFRLAVGSRAAQTISKGTALLAEKRVLDTNAILRGIDPMVTTNREMRTSLLQQKAALMKEVNTYNDTATSQEHVAHDAEAELLKSMVDFIKMANNTPQAHVQSLESALVSAREQLDQTLHTQERTNTQLEQSQVLIARLRKEVEEERVNMNRKYYKDLETPVEERVQQEKAKFVRAETKIHRYEAAESKCALLEDQLQVTIREVDRHKAAKAELEQRYRQLKEREEVTQQGYTQMAQDKHEAEVKAAALESDLSALRADMGDLRENLADTQTGSRQIGQSSERLQARGSVEIVIHSEQLTEADRVEMIALRWRNDLQLAESEQRRHERALEDTGALIAAAACQLEGLQAGSKARRKGRNHSQASATAADEMEASNTVSTGGASESPTSGDRPRITSGTRT
jgi:hypothetical protein